MSTRPELPPRREILGVGVHPLTLDEAAGLVRAWIRAEHAWEELTGARDKHAPTRQVVTLNTEMLYRALRDKALRDLINSADLVVPDGHGVVWAGRQLGQFLPARVAGIDLVAALAAHAAREKWRLFLLGAAPGVAEEAARNLARAYPGLEVAGVAHGYFPEEEAVVIVRRIRAAAPDLLLVALGSPKQEFFIWAHRKELGAIVAMGVGGAFDVLAGRLRRAPRVFQDLHLEWLFRLLQQPRRWRRMTVLPLFAWTVKRHAWLQKRAERKSGRGE